MAALASPSAAAQTTVLKPVGTVKFEKRTKLKPSHGMKTERERVGCLSASVVACISRNQPFFQHGWIVKTHGLNEDGMRRREKESRCHYRGLP